MIVPEVAVLLVVPKEVLLREVWEALLVEGLGVGGRDVDVLKKNYQEDKARTKFIPSLLLFIMKRPSES
jgi:hypothetical protein